MYGYLGDERNSYKISAVPCFTDAILITALEGIHECVRGLSSQAISVQELLKPVARIETEEQDGEDSEHQQNSDGQNSIRQVICSKVLNTSIIMQHCAYVSSPLVPQERKGKNVKQDTSSQLHIGQEEEGCKGIHK